MYIEVASTCPFSGKAICVSCFILPLISCLFKLKRQRWPMTSIENQNRSSSRSYVAACVYEIDSRPLRTLTRHYGNPPRVYYDVRSQPLRLYSDLNTISNNLRFNIGNIRNINYLPLLNYITDASIHAQFVILMFIRHSNKCSTIKTNLMYVHKKAHNDPILRVSFKGRSVFVHNKWEIASKCVMCKTRILHEYA